MMDNLSSYVPALLFIFPFPLIKFMVLAAGFSEHFAFRLTAECFVAYYVSVDHTTLEGLCTFTQCKIYYLKV